MEERSRARAAFAGIVQLVGGVAAAGEYGRVVLVESAGHADRALSLSGPDGLVFSPDEGRPAAGVVEYEGGVSAPGDEFLVGDDLVVHTQDYLATPFLAVAGPTIVRIGGEQDYQAFLQDADLARDQGVFVEQLLTPGVFLADHCALGTTHPCAGSRRLHVSASGDVRTAPGGEVLGSVESEVDALENAATELGAAGDVCLNALVGADVIDSARTARPWLSRYLRVLAVLRGLRAEGRTGLRVSGFGGRFTAALPTELTEHPDAPILVWNDGEQLLCDTAQDRVFQLGVDAARIVELLLVTGAAEPAAGLASIHMGLSDTAARDAVDAVIMKFAGTGVLPGDQSAVRAGTTSPAS